MFKNFFFIFVFITTTFAWYNDTSVIKQTLNVEEYINSCGIYYPPKNFLTAAIDFNRYYNGTACGNCIEGIINKNIQFKAIVNDLCSECNDNEILINLDNNKNIQKLPISWKTIDCPSSQPIFITENSNSYYGKLKILDIGKIRQVKINNINAIRTFDNFWFVLDFDGLLGCGPLIQITDWNDKITKYCLDKNYFGGYCPNQNIKCTI